MSEELQRAIAQQVRERLLQSEDFETDELLSGMCAVGSIALAKSFARHGLDYMIAEGYWQDKSHCWLISGGLIIDVTLTQFIPEAEPVFIALASEYHFALKLWDSIQDAEESTWVAECEIDWDSLIVKPQISFA